MLEVRELEARGFRIFPTIDFHRYSCSVVDSIHPIRVLENLFDGQAMVRWSLVVQEDQVVQVEVEKPWLHDSMLYFE